jgi:hypothetical protein
MKKEKTNKEKEEAPKDLVQTPSIYTVKIDPEKAKSLGFPKKIMEKLIPYYPLAENQTVEIELELKDFESGIISTFNVPKNHKYYGIYEQMYFSRSPEKKIEDKLLALSSYVSGVLRSLGFEVPRQNIEKELGKITVHMKVKRLEKINNVLKKYKEKLSTEVKETPAINFDVEKGELYWINEKGKKFIYHLKIDSLNYKIVHYLASEKDFVPTQEIADEYGKDTNTIRSIISKLRKGIKKNLKIDGEQIIENVPSKFKGYRIKNIKMIEESSDNS